jgi:adenosylmethionine---8-amino-7-oxononanoate aminotransferase
MHPLAELDHTHLWHPFTQQRSWVATEPLIIESASGSYLTDVHGKRYIDGVSSLWTNIHGHRHPALDKALREQLDKVAHTTLLGLSHPTAITLAKRLSQMTPGRLQRVFYSDNGSTATEVALKMAFQYQQQVGQTARTRFASLSGAYHGDTLGAVSVGGIGLFHEIYRPLLFEGVVLPAPTSPGGSEEERCLQQALSQLEVEASSLAALIVEPLVQGAAGMKMHTPKYLSAILQRARQLGILVVADEVAVGFGRTGSMFAMEQVDFVPDFLCLAKGIAAGYLPLAATLTTETIYTAFLAEPDAYRQFFHGHTFTGNPLACAVALASLDVFEQEDTLVNASHVATVMRDGLADLTSEASEIRQRGVMIGIDLLGEAEGSVPDVGAGHQVCSIARSLGAILRPLGNTVVLNPPLSITPEDASTLIQIVTEAIRSR